MSNLNEVIAQWRKPLELRLGAKAADELEDHLREVVESLTSTGLPEQERFVLALHRIGQTETLATEFEKNGSHNVWRERVIWLLIGLVPLHLLYTSMQVLGAALGMVLIRKGTSPLVATFLHLIPQLIVLGGVLGGCLWVVSSNHPLQWSLKKWFPTLFPLRAIFSISVVLILMFVSHLAGPLSIPMFIATSIVDEQRYEYRMSSYHHTAGISRFGLELGYSVVSVMLIAWLVLRRKDESGPATVSAEDS